MAADQRLCQGIVHGGQRCPHPSIDGQPFCADHGGVVSTISDRDRLLVMAEELPDDLVAEAVAALRQIAGSRSQPARSFGWSPLGPGAALGPRPS